MVAAVTAAVVKIGSSSAAAAVVAVASGQELKAPGASAGMTAKAAITTLPIAFIATDSSGAVV